MSDGMSTEGCVIFSKRTYARVNPNNVSIIANVPVAYFVRFLQSAPKSQWGMLSSTKCEARDNVGARMGSRTLKAIAPATSV